MRRPLLLLLAALLGTAGLGGGHLRAAPAEVPVDGFCAGVPAGPGFDDIAGDTFELHIRCLGGLALTTGVRPGAYDPTGVVSREQMASFVARLIDHAAATAPGLRPLPAHDGLDRFPDVSGTHRVSINRLAASGIVQGGPGGLPADHYGPGLAVSREQMATFIVRALDHLRERTSGHADDQFADDDASVHEPRINAVAALGIAVGDGTSYFPGRRLSRAQMAAFLVRTLASIATTNPPAPPPSPAWHDIDTVVTAYRTYSGLDCGLREGDEPTWGRDAVGRLQGGIWMAELDGTAVADPRPRATWIVEGWVASPWGGHAARVEPVGIDILGVDLRQVDNDDYTVFDPFDRRIRETRVALDDRPEGWITCDYYGWWTDPARLAISEPDTSENGEPSAFWWGTVDVAVEGGIPPVPEMPVIEVPSVAADVPHHERIERAIAGG